MSMDVVNRKKSLASIKNADNKNFARGTSLLQSLRSSHTILRMIRLRLAPPSPMITVVMMILFLNLHMQNQREMSTIMLHQRLCQLYCHQRHLILIQRDLQWHQILLQRERAHLQRGITLSILSGLRTRITALRVQSLTENYMPLHVGVIINNQFPRSCLRSVRVWITNITVADWGIK